MQIAVILQVNYFRKWHGTFIHRIKTGVIIVLLLQTVQGCRGVKVSNSVKNDTLNIYNSKTAEHINIKGTRLFLIPAGQYEQFEIYTGLEIDKTSTLQVFDIVGGNYYTKVAKYNRDSAVKPGFIVSEFEECNVNGYPAKFAVCIGSSGNNLAFIGFGDSSFLTFINAVYPASDTSSLEKIKRTFNSIYYDTSYHFNPFPNPHFDINDSSSRFKFSNYYSGIYAYTYDGIKSDTGSKAPKVLVTVYNNRDGLVAEEIVELFSASMRTKGVSGRRILERESSTRNGFSIYEVTYAVTFNGMPARLQYTIVMGNKTAVCSTSLIHEDFETQIHEIRKLTETIKPK